MTASGGSARSSKEELTAALLAPAPSSKRSAAAGSTGSAAAAGSGTGGGGGSAAAASVTAATDSASASSTAVATSSRHSRPWPFERSRASTSSSASSLSSSGAKKAGGAGHVKLNKNGCLPGCSTFPRCSCRLKSSLKEKLKSKFDLSTFFGLTKESEVLSGVRLLADLVEDGKVGLSDCIDRKVMERLTSYLTVPGLQAAALETLGVLLYVWLRVTKASTKKGNSGSSGKATAAIAASSAAAAGGTALATTTAATAGCTAVGAHKHGQANCSVCPSCMTQPGAAAALPASSPLPPLSLDDWLCTPAATALISHTLPLLRPLSTRHMASYVLLHFCICRGTLVKLADGTAVAIEDVQVGAEVLSYHAALGPGEKEGLTVRQVDAVLDRGHRACVELVFNDGRTLICTPDHRIRTADGRWVAAEDLEVGTTDVAIGVEYPNLTDGAEGAGEGWLDTRTTLTDDLDIAERVLPLSRVQLVGRREVGVRHVYDLSVPSAQGEECRSFLAAGIVVHNCDGARAATTFIQTPNAIPVLLDVYASLTDSKDTSMLLELSSIITGIAIKPTRETLPKLLPIAPVLLAKFRANSNPLMTAYICKALGRLCDGQKDIAELVLNANISSYLLFLYWNAVDNERTKHRSDAESDVLFEDIFGLLGLLAFYERPSSQKLLAPLPTFPASTPFSMSSVNESEQKMREEERLRAISWTGPKRTDAEVYAEQERLVETYMKAQSAPDLVDIISVVLDLVVPAAGVAPSTPPLAPSSTDWYYVQCAAWQISMILTNGMAVRDSQHRRQRLINSLVFKKILRAIDLYAATMPSACLCALSQALSYSVLGASSAQIGYLVCEGILHTLLLVVQHQKTSRKCLLCVLHAMNAILSMGERDRVPGRRSDLWGDEEDDDDREDDDVWAEEDEDDLVLHESSEDEYVAPESEKKRRGEGESDDSQQRGIRRRRKRERPGDKWGDDDGEPHRDSLSLHVRNNRPRSQVVHHHTTAAAVITAGEQSPASTAVPSAADEAGQLNGSASTSGTSCPHCHRSCSHCEASPPSYTGASTSPPAAASPYNGYVVLLRLLYGIDSILSRLELSTSKRTSKEEQSLLSLIRKLLSYFHHTPDWRLNNPLMQREDAQSPDHPPPPAQPSPEPLPDIDWSLRSPSGDAGQEVVVAGGDCPYFRRRVLSPTSRRRQRWKEKRQSQSSRVQFDRKRRELRFLLIGVRGELPMGLQRQPKKAKEAVKEPGTPGPAKAAPAAASTKAEPHKKPSIEELLRQMQEKERLRTELEDKKRELKERKARLERDLKDQAASTQPPSTPAPGLTTSASLDDVDVGSESDDDPSPSIAVDDKAKRAKEKRAKKKAKAKKNKAAAAAAAEKSGAKAALKRAMSDDKAALEEFDASVGGEASAVEREREDDRTAQDEMERKRIDAALAAEAEERARDLRESRAQLEAALKAKAEIERALVAEKERREKALQREADEKQRRRQRQADELEQAKARERDLLRRAELERERAEAERLREEERREKEKAQAAAAALAFASRPIHPCRHGACPLDGRITASQYYVRLVCSAHCHIFFHHAAPSSSAAEEAGEPRSCWQLVPSSSSAPDIPLSSVISSSSPCPTPDCDGTILSLTLLHGKDETIATLIRPPPTVKKASAPTESKRERRARKREEEERKRFDAEEKKEDVVDAVIPAKPKGGFEVLVPAKEKDFTPVIARPSLFSPTSPPDESKERAAPTSPPSPSSTAAAHPPPKRGRQARKTRIDIYLPQAEEEVEEAEAAEVEADEPYQLPLHSIEMSGSAYGGVVRTVADGSSTSLLYVRAFGPEAAEEDREAVTQWLVGQCALVAPVYVTRFFAPTAVLVKYESAAIAERAYAALHERMFMQFAVEPCSIVTGSAAHDLTAYYDVLMHKARNGLSFQQPEFASPASYDLTAEQAQDDVIPLYPSSTSSSSSSSSSSLHLTSPPPPPSRSGLEAVRRVEEDEGELNTDQFDFSFLAIGGEDEPRAPVRTESLSPPLEARRSAWTSPASDGGAAWSTPSPAAPPSFSALPSMSSLFSPMHLASPSSTAPLFSPTSPAQKEKLSALTPALDPIHPAASPPMSSSLSFTQTVSEGAASSRVTSSYFSSSSLFSASPPSAGASTSSLFQLSSFSMFSSSASTASLDSAPSSTQSLTSSTSSFASPTSGGSSFFSSTPSASSLAPPAVPSRAPLPSAEREDDYYDDVWNDEKMSSLVLKSDGEDDDDPALAPVPTHPRHDSIDQSTTDSHDRDSTDSLSQHRQLEGELEREYSMPDSPRSSHTATPPLPYGVREYGTSSPSQPQPRFTRPWYPSGAGLPSIPPPPMYNAPGTMPHDPTMYPAAYGYGAGGMASMPTAFNPPSFAYAGGPYGQQGYPAMMAGGPGWYPAAAGYPVAAAPYGVQMAMGMGVMPYLVGPGGRSVPYVPLRRMAQKTGPMSPLSGQPSLVGLNGGDYRQYSDGGSNGQLRPDDADERGLIGAGRERGREKKGFVVDMEDFPSLAPVGAGPSLGSPSAASTAASSLSSPASTVDGHAATHSSVLSSTFSSQPSAPPSPHSDVFAGSAGAASDAPTWTGHLAQRLTTKAPPSVSSPSAAATAALSAYSAQHPSLSSLTSPTAAQAHAQSTPLSHSSDGPMGKSRQGQWRSQQPPNGKDKDKDRPLREPDAGAAMRSKKESRGSTEKGGERRRLPGKANGGDSPLASGNSPPAGRAGLMAGGIGAGSSEWTEVAKKKRNK